MVEKLYKLGWLLPEEATGRSYRPNRASVWLFKRVVSCSLLMLVGWYSGSGALPTGAAGAIFGQCVINEQPKLAEIAPGQTGKYKWFSGQWYSKQKPARDLYSEKDGILRLSLGGCLVSAPNDFGPGLLPVLRGAKGFYVEFEISLSDEDADHFPAVWLMPVEHNREKDDVYGGDPTEFERWIEFDVDEGGSVLGYGGAVHVWQGIYPAYQRVTQINPTVVKIDRTKFHRYGLCYTPSSQEITWWLDDQKQYALQADIHKVAQLQNFYLIISAQHHGLGHPYQISVKSIRAYQAL
jgi:hypothetical protein